MLVWGLFGVKLGFLCAAWSPWGYLGGLGTLSCHRLVSNVHLLAQLGRLGGHLGGLGGIFVQISLLNSVLFGVGALIPKLNKKVALSTCKSQYIIWFPSMDAAVSAQRSQSAASTLVDG